MSANPYQATDTDHSQKSEGQGGEPAAPAVDVTPLTKRPRAAKSESAFRTISEVAEELDLQQHVLRFWETKFSQIKPLKRGGGRRYYRPEDVELLKHIHRLLYTEGYTIKGVQKLMREHGKQRLGASTGMAEPSSAVQSSPSQPTNSAPAGLSDQQKNILKSMLSDLKELRNMIASES